MITWTCEQRGRWLGVHHDGRQVAKSHRTREGALHCHDVMWYTTLNGQWLINADSLAHAKRAVALATDYDVCVALIQATIDRLEGAGTVLSTGQRVDLTNARAALAGDPHGLVVHAVHL